MPALIDQESEGCKRAMSVPDRPATGIWICTSSTWFDFEDPEGSPIRIGDIAHALSNACRFNGHTQEFYSIAHHSVLVAEVVPPEDALWGLLHDASEAYMGDMVRPLKRLPFMQGFRDLEDRITRRIVEEFGLSMPMPESVAHADLVVLETERRDLITPDPPWTTGVLPLETRIVPWGPSEARIRFLEKFYELLGMAA